MTLSAFDNLEGRTEAETSSRQQGGKIDHYHCILVAFSKMLKEEDEFRQNLAVFKAESKVLALLVPSAGCEGRVCSRLLFLESQASVLCLSIIFPLCVFLCPIPLFIRTLVILD